MKLYVTLKSVLLLRLLVKNTCESISFKPFALWTTRSKKSQLKFASIIRKSLQLHLKYSKTK